MERIVDSLMRVLYNPDGSKLEVPQGEETLRDTVQREALRLLQQYPGGVTEAILQTHVHSRFSIARLDEVSLQDAHKGEHASLPGTVPLHKVKPVSQLPGGTGLVLQADVAEVSFGGGGVLSDCSNVLRPGCSSGDGIDLVLSQTSSHRRGIMRIARRYEPLIKGPNPLLSAGTKLRLGNVQAFGRKLPAPRDGSSGKGQLPPIRLLPTEQMVVISERVEELLDSETVGADLMSVALEPGAGAVLPETRLAARVVGVGAERRGCPGGCTLCNNSKQVHGCMYDACNPLLSVEPSRLTTQGRHRCLILERLGIPQGPPGLWMPLMLYDKQVAVGDLLLPGEVLAIDKPTLRRLRPAAVSLMDEERGCILGADENSVSVADAREGDLCLEIGAETLLFVGQERQPDEQGVHKKHKLDTSQSPRQSTAPAIEATLTGEVSSLRLVEASSKSSVSKIWGTGTKSGPSAMAISLRTGNGLVEVHVTGSCSAIMQAACVIREGHVIAASPAVAEGVRRGGLSTAFSLELGPESILASLSALPGLMTSPQLHRHYLQHLSEALSALTGSPSGCERPLADPARAPSLHLVSCVLLQAHVAVRRAHNRCQRPLSGSSMFEGFFDDEDEDEGMGGENAGCAEAAFVPVTPSRLGSNFRDGLWSCSFCDRECGSAEIALELVGFVLVQDSDPRSRGGAPVWVAVQGEALETLVGFNAMSYTSLAPGERGTCLQELRGRRVTLSLVRRVEGDLGASHRLSFGGWSLDNCRKASGSEDSWSATGGAAVAAVRPFLP